MGQFIMPRTTEAVRGVGVGNRVSVAHDGVWECGGISDGAPIYSIRVYHVSEWFRKTKVRLGQVGVRLQNGCERRYEGSHWGGGCGFCVFAPLREKTLNQEVEQCASKGAEIRIVSRAKPQRRKGRLESW